MGKHWLDKPPRTIKDWLGIMLCCIAFWALLNGMNGILDALGTLWGLAAPFAWAAVLAAFACMKRWGDRTGPLPAWLGKRSFGLYVLHYLPLAAAAWGMDRFLCLPAPVCYLLAAAAAFGGGYGLNALISKAPVLRWCVLGKRKEKDHVSG